VGFEGAGCRVRGPAFRAQGVGVRVEGLGSRVEGVSFRVWRVYSFVFRGQGPHGGVRPSKVNLPHVINLRALCGAILVS